MQRRLLLLVIGFVVVLVAALGLPLAVASVEGATQQLFISRINDTAWLADTAETGMQTGRLERLRGALQRYERIFDVQGCVVDVDFRIVASSPSLTSLESAAVRTALIRALAGRPPQAPTRLWPWTDDQLVVAEPIVRDNRTLGAVITVSDTSKVRAEITRPLLLIAFGGLGALVVATLVLAIPVVRWVLRPVRELDHAAHEVAAGELTTRVSTSTGAPELRRLAKSFNDMANSVTVLMRKQKDFVAEASHRLRNPLAALQLRLENTRALVNAETPKEELDFALKETRRLSDMVDSMLALARAETSHQEPETVDATAIVHERIAIWRTAYTATGTPLLTQVANGLLAHCARESLENGLDALLDNALKYAPGAPVRVRAWREHDSVVIEVADSGEGLPDGDLLRVSDRFWRSSRHQNHRGSGLGLALTRTEVEAHGGTVGVHRGDPHGLTVSLRVPCAEQIVSGALPGTTAQHPDGGREGKSRSPSADRDVVPPDAPGSALPAHRTASESTSTPGRGASSWPPRGMRAR